MGTMRVSLAILNSSSCNPSSMPRDLTLLKEPYHVYSDSACLADMIGFQQQYPLPLSCIPSESIMQNTDAIPLTSQHVHFPLSANADAHVRCADDDVEPEYAVEDAYNSIGALQLVNRIAEYPQQLDHQQYLDTLEPRMTLWRRESCSFFDTMPQTSLDFPNNGYGINSAPIDFGSPLYQPCFQQDQLNLSDEEPSPTSSHTALSTTPCKQSVDNEQATDKPYARLIYECLMQAPGHRMMLREIYDWFIANTTKPQESGTNGWQNSIRHNLSMNQAFENDKSTCSPGRSQARKANSVWVLTKHAEKNGVQSTTRYRKSGAVKKSAFGHTFGVQRPRSDARGARATRKARLRMQVQPLNSAEIYSLSQEVAHLPLCSMHLDGSVAAQAHGSECQHLPTPPAVESMFEPLHSPVMMPNSFEADQSIKVEHDDFFLDNEVPTSDYFHHAFVNPIFESMTKIETN